MQFSRYFRDVSSQSRYLRTYTERPRESLAMRHVARNNKSRRVRRLVKVGLIVRARARAMHFQMRFYDERAFPTRERHAKRKASTFAVLLALCLSSCAFLGILCALAHWLTLVSHAQHTHTALSRFFQRVLSGRVNHD